jgi:hypothetical protein
MKPILFALSLALPVAANAQTAKVSAQPPVSLVSKVFIVRQVTDAQGKKKNVLLPPERVIPGEPVTIVLEYKNPGPKPASAFVINNAVPAAVNFTGVEQAWAVVSVDSGKTYGALATLKIAKADGTIRAALPSDVTNVRWKFAQPIAPLGTGRVSFFGTVK